MPSGSRSPIRPPPGANRGRQVSEQPGRAPEVRESQACRAAARERIPGAHEHAGRNERTGKEPDLRRRTWKCHQPRETLRSRRRGGGAERHILRLVRLERESTDELGSARHQRQACDESRQGPEAIRQRCGVAPERLGEALESPLQIFERPRRFAAVLSGVQREVQRAPSAAEGRDGGAGEYDLVGFLREKIPGPLIRDADAGERLVQLEDNRLHLILPELSVRSPLPDRACAEVTEAGRRQRRVDRVSIAAGDEEIDVVRAPLLAVVEPPAHRRTL
jgi:hypothetical protein